METFKQINKIDKANKKHELDKMINTEIRIIVEKLNRYAQIFNERNETEINNFTSDEDRDELNQPEVESLMLKVRIKTNFKF